MLKNDKILQNDKIFIKQNFTNPLYERRLKRNQSNQSNQSNYSNYKLEKEGGFVIK